MDNFSDSNQFFNIVYILFVIWFLIGTALLIWGIINSSLGKNNYLPEKKNIMIIRSSLLAVFLICYISLLMLFRHDLTYGNILLSLIINGLVIGLNIKAYLNPDY